MAEPFATVDDLAARWRTLTEAEEARADVLLGDASAHIRALSSGIDDRITAGDLDPLVPVAVACSMVKRAMQGPTDLDGVAQVSQAAGPFNQGVTFANPAGELYLTKAEKARLRIGAQVAFTVDLLATDDEDEDDES